MLRALLYLRLTSLKNRVRTQLLRLRQPKYLIGAVFVVAYFWFFFFRPASPSRQAFAGNSPIGTLPPDVAPLLLGLVALGLTIVVVLMWLVPDATPGVKFTEAEIAFLFPAPVTRRSLIHFKVLSLQFSTLFQSFFFSLLFNHRNLLHGHAIQTVLSWWVVISFVSLHYLGASLTIARLNAHGVPTRRRRAWIALGGGLALAAAVAWIWHGLPGVKPDADFVDLLPVALNTGALTWILWPVKLLLAPFFAKGLPAFALALAPALAVLAAHYLWVVRIEVSFEEASVVQAERQAARLAEIRRTGTVQLGTAPRTGRRPPFDVARAPWPEVAFLWKNLLSTIRPWFTVRAWLIAATVLVVLSVVLQYALGSSYWMAGGALAGLGMLATLLTLFYGPLLTRLDLRQDLANVDLLRSYPLPGWRILLGELLAPTVVLSGLIWLGLLAWYLGLHGHHPPKLSEVWFAPAMRIVLVGTLGFLTPFVVTLQLLVPNGAVILFPAMFRTAHTPGTGIDLMGQRMLFGFGQIFILGLVLLPAVATAGVLIFCTQWLIGPAAAVIFATLAVAFVLTGEIWCGIWWLGERFERIDLSTDLRP